MLAELILDASVKIGEFTKELPKAKGGEHYHRSTPDTAVASGIQKPKADTIRELGFPPKQIGRFETLANNKDVVEQVKAEARENDDIPTRVKAVFVSVATTRES